MLIKNIRCFFFASELAYENLSNFLTFRNQKLGFDYHSAAKNWRSHLQSDLNAKCWFWEKWEKSVLWNKSKIFKICLGESKGSTFTHLIIFLFLKNTNAVLLQCLTKKKITSFRSLCRYEKHVSNFFWSFQKSWNFSCFILLCNTNMPQSVKNPEKYNHFYESNFSNFQWRIPAV